MPDPDLIATLVTALAIARGEPEAVVRTRFGIEPPWSERMDWMIQEMRADPVAYVDKARREYRSP